MGSGSGGKGRVYVWTFAEGGLSKSNKCKERGRAVQILVISLDCNNWMPPNSIENNDFSKFLPWSHWETDTLSLVKSMWWKDSIFRRYICLSLIYIFQILCILQNSDEKYEIIKFGFSYVSYSVQNNFHSVIQLHLKHIFICYILCIWY